MKQKLILIVLTFSYLISMASYKPKLVNAALLAAQQCGTFPKPVSEAKTQAWWLPSDPLKVGGVDSSRDLEPEDQYSFQLGDVSTDKHGRLEVWVFGEGDCRLLDIEYFQDQLRRLQKLLQSQSHLNENQISQFVEKLKESASLDLFYSVNQEETIALPTKIVIVCANFLNMERLRKGIWSFAQHQAEEAIIEQHLVKNPDPEVRKVVHEHGFYFTF